MQDDLKKEIGSVTQATVTLTTVVGLLIKHLVASGNLDGKAMLATLDTVRKEMINSEISESEKSVTRSVLRLIESCLQENTSTNNGGKHP